jgi:hypothetical protein
MGRNKAPNAVIIVAKIIDAKAAIKYFVGLITTPQ